MKVNLVERISVQKLEESAFICRVNPVIGLVYSRGVARYRVSQQTHPANLNSYFSTAETRAHCRPLMSETRPTRTPKNMKPF